MLSAVRWMHEMRGTVTDGLDHLDIQRALASAKRDWGYRDKLRKGNRLVVKRIEEQKQATAAQPETKRDRRKGDRPKRKRGPRTCRIGVDPTVVSSGAIWNG